MIIDMRIPTEKELQKEIQEFQENLQKKYGPGVGFRIVTSNVDNKGHQVHLRKTHQNLRKLLI